MTTVTTTTNYPSVTVVTMVMLALTAQMVRSLLVITMISTACLVPEQHTTTCKESIKS